MAEGLYLRFVGGGGLGWEARTREGEWGDRGRYWGMWDVGWRVR